MKVLHLIDSGGLYGAEVMLLELLNEQKKLGMDVCVCSIGIPSIKEKALEKELKKRNVPLRIERMMPGPSFLGAHRILSFAKSEKVNVLHSHGYKTDILMGAIPKILRGIPLVATLHGRTSSRKLSKLYFYELVDSLILRHIDKVIFVSDEMLTSERKLSRNKNISVIKNGIAENLEKKIIDSYEIQKINQLKLNNTVIGSIGRLSKEKAFDILIQAFGEYKKKSACPAKLVIIGEGPEEKSLKQLAKDLHIEEDVWFPGYIDRAGTMIEYFDVYINSSLTEGTPITLLEAMRAEIPIIASRVGGNQSLLGSGEFGWLFEKGGIEDLSALINHVLSKGAISKVKKAREVFEAEYSSAKMAACYSEIYDEVV